MNRQYVHLSEDIDTAILVAKRKGKDLMILSIDTISAIDKGIKFYLGNEKIWLVDHMPFEFISIFTQK